MYIMKDWLKSFASQQEGDRDFHNLVKQM